MPHFGLMDPDALGPEKAALMRAKLHVRGGKRRLRQGKTASGLVTLIDALTYGVQWYLESPDRRAAAEIEESHPPRDEREAFGLLVRADVVKKGTVDYALLEDITQRALDQYPLEDLPGFDVGEVVSSLEEALTQIGVLPFDESSLPPEDPATY